MTPDDLVSLQYLSEQTVKKILNGESVSLSTVATLCISLGCELTDIVALNYAYNPAEMKELTKSSESASDTSRTQKERVGYHLWTKEEEDQLIEEYTRGEALAEIAKKHRRTTGGIVARINRLIEAGRITDPSVSAPDVPESPESFIADIPVEARDSISISELARRISERTKRKIRYNDIASWLVSVHDLDEQDEVGEKVKIPTQQGEIHGIKRGKRTNSAGMEYVGVYLEPAAQRYIVDNLPSILAFMNQK